MAISRDPDSIGRLIRAIQQLPSDKRVADRQPGYNKHNTQKDHWLGWLGATPPGPGTYARKTGKNRDAQYVYNHIKEPKMLLWLVAAAGVKPELMRAAQRASNSTASIRKHVPWSEVATALWRGDRAAG
jgi:hypothetical protein